MVGESQRRHHAREHRNYASPDWLLANGGGANESTARAFLAGAVCADQRRRSEREKLVVIVAQLHAYEPPMSRWRQWQRSEPAIGKRNFAAVRHELLDRAVPTERKDEILGALIRLGQHGPDDDARLATIVCLLPGARRLARQFGDILGWDDALAEVLASLLFQLEALDLDRRADRIASRLLSATADRLASLARRERERRDRTSSEPNLDSLDPPALGIEPKALSSAVTMGVLGTLDATLIEATRLNGLTLADAAMLLGLGYEAAKKRRRRAEAALVTWWAPDRIPLYRSVEPVAA